MSVTSATEPPRAPSIAMPPQGLFEVGGGFWVAREREPYSLGPVCGDGVAQRILEAVSRVRTRVIP